MSRPRLALAHVLAALVGVSFAKSALAADSGAPAPALPVGADGAEDDDSPAAPALSGYVAIQTLTTYMYRGFLTEDRGAIVQATVGLNGSVPVSGWFESIDLHGEFFASFGDGPSGTGGPNESPRAFTEADLTLGVTATTSGGFSLDVSWQRYRAPNASFEKLEELGLTLELDDGDAHAGGRFRGWHPSLTLGVELLGREDGSGSRGVFLGAGIAPEFLAWDGEDAPTIRVPVSVGTSLSDYYEDAEEVDRFLGFVEVGCDLEVPVGGAWTVILSAHAVFLGPTPREVGGDRDVRLVVTAGLSFAF